MHGGRLVGGTTRREHGGRSTAGGTVTRSSGPAARARARRSPRSPRRPALLPRGRPCTGAGRAALRTALLLPSWHEPGRRRCRCCIDPYGGPHAQRVRRRPRRAYLTAQWFADQGFAVVVADGRGTPGPRPGVGAGGRTATSPGRSLEDQVDALHALRPSASRPRPDRVAIRGWSLRRLPGRAGRAAPPGRLPRRGRRRAGHRLAPLRHPLHRALPRPPGRRSRRRTTRSSLLADAARAGPRPLLLIHGLADDNVVAAHTLRLSSALLAAGRPHSVLPLSGRHPHDPAGGGGGEPAAAPGGLPPRRARSPRADVTPDGSGRLAHRPTRPAPGGPRDRTPAPRRRPVRRAAAGRPGRRGHLRRRRPRGRARPDRHACTTSGSRTPPARSSTPPGTAARRSASRSAPARSSPAGTRASPA